MNPIQRWQFKLFQTASGSDIGRQHAFFNQFVRLKTLMWDDATDLAFLVETKFRLH